MQQGGMTFTGDAGPGSLLALFSFLYEAYFLFYTSTIFDVLLCSYYATIGQME